MPEKPKLENAKTEIFGFGVLFSLTRHLILSLPSGEMSRSDREGRLPREGAGLPLCGKTEGVLSDWQDTHEICSDADLSACCSFRHGLRRATFLREEGFGFTRHLILSLPLGEMSRSDREGRLPREGAGLPLCGKTEGVLQIDKIRLRLALMQTCPRATPFRGADKFSHGAFFYCVAVRVMV